MDIFIKIISIFLMCNCVTVVDPKDDEENLLKPTFWLSNRDTKQYEIDLEPSPNFYWNLDMRGVVSRDTKMLLHGWGTGRYSRFTTQLRDAYLEEMDVNIIAVDWSGLANQEYNEVLNKLNKVAGYVTSFIRYLIEYQNIDLNRIHFIGYGLGAHLAGLSCKPLRPKVQAITALDPISLLCKESAKYRLCSTDAQYVEVIHTGTRRFIGPLITMGHADFFPNGGKLQPGCGLDLLAKCSGERSVDLFIQSIKATHPVFIGVRCNSILEAVQQRCSSIVKGQMGGKNITKKYGIYSVQTIGEPPFYTDNHH